MSRELSSFPLPPLHQMKLKSAGFQNACDVLEMRPSELSKELNLPVDEALEIINTVKEQDKKNETRPKTVTALDMLKDEDLQQSIITFSEQIDHILGGGVPLGKITEFCGAPGIGKTQMCIQLCVDSQIPDCFGGLEGEAIFIDTEGSFLVDRVADIAKATVAHCQQVTNSENNPEQKLVMQRFDFKSVLKGIHYFRCHDHIELLALMQMLPDILKEYPKVKVIACDSIAFPFRHEFEDLSLRTRLLNGLAQGFIRLATRFKLAVVLTNQMTTKIRSDRISSGLSSSELAPALGESWGHASTIRVILYWEGGVRHALLYKSPSHEEAVVPYQITTGGIRDIMTKNSAQSSHAADECLTPPVSKRQKINY